MPDKAGRLCINTGVCVVGRNWLNFKRDVIMSIEKLYLYDRGKVKIGGPRTKVIVLHTLKRVLERQGFQLNDDLDNKSVWSTEELFKRLEEYGRPSDFLVDDKAWRVAYSRTLEAFGCKGEKLMPLEDVNLMQAVQAEKSAGLPTLRKKGQVFDIERRRMQRIRADKCAPPPCVAYHRVQHGDTGPKTRLVWGYPLSMTLLEAQFAAPLIEAFLSRQSPMAFGCRKVDLVARMIPVTRAETVLALDYSKFDSSVHAKLIVMAFNVLGTWFSAEAKKVGRWDKIVHYFIHTPILMADGYVYRKHSGVPSGSFFTQLVDSVVNYFAMQYISARLGVAMDGLVLGDDSLFSVASEGADWLRKGPLGLWKCASVVLELGLRVNVDKSRVYLGRSREAVHFLGHTWSRGYPHRVERDIVRRAVYPERFLVGSDAREIERQRVLMLLGDAVESWRIFRQYIKPSRHGVCFTSSLGVREVAAFDVGWYRNLVAAGQKVVVSKLAYQGLMF
jgi:hypothetical protein